MRFDLPFLRRTSPLSKKGNDDNQPASAPLVSTHVEGLAPSRYPDFQPLVANPSKEGPCPAPERVHFGFDSDGQGHKHVEGKVRSPRSFTNFLVDDRKNSRSNPIKNDRPPEFNLLGRLIRSITPLKKTGLAQTTDQRLRELEKTVVDSSDLHAIAGFNRILEVGSGRWQELLGYRPEEIWGNDLLDLIHQDDRSNVNSSLNQLVQLKKGQVVFETRVHTKNGKFLWLEWQAIADSITQKLYLIANDITSAKEEVESLEIRNDSLWKLSRMATLPDMELETFLDVLLKEGMQVLKVLRLSLWELNPTEEFYTCQHTQAWDNDTTPAPQNRSPKEFPMYFERLIAQRSLGIPDCSTEPFLEKLYRQRLKPRGIKRVLETYVQTPNFTGFLSAECISVRSWQPNDQNYLASMAELIVTANIWNACNQMNKALEASQRRYYSVISAMDEGLLVLGKAETVIMSNESAARILGINGGKIRGLTPEELPWVSHMDEAATSPGQPHPALISLRTGMPVNDHVMQVLRNDAGPRLVSLTSRAIWGPNKEITEVALYFKDITKQRLAQNALEESELKYRQLVESSDSIHWKIDLKSNRVNYMDPRIESLLGFPVDTWKTHGFWLSHVEDQDREAVRQFRKQLRAPGKSIQLEYRIRSAEKQLIWVRDSYSVINRNGLPAELIGFMIDITAAKRSEAQLKRSEEQYRSLVENTSDLIVLFSPEGRIKYISKNIENLTGFTPEEYAQFGPVDNVHPVDKDRLLRALYRMQNGLTTHVSEYRIQKKNGNFIWLQTRSVVLRDTEGKLEGILTNSNDITSLKNTEESLRKLLKTSTLQNERMKEFSYITSHNLRASVANMLGLSEIIRSDPENTEYFNMLHSSIHRLNGVVSNVNHLLNFEKDLATISSEPCSIRKALDRVIELNGQVIKKREVNFLLDVDPELKVLAIPAYLESIIHNLITNAIKYGLNNRDKRIEVRAEQRDQIVLLSVQDFGQGIDLKRFGHKVFQLGARFHSNQPGQGLGLFMTKHQIESMGGSINVESEPGKGARFIVTFYEKE